MAKLPKAPIFSDFCPKTAFGPLQIAFFLQKRECYSLYEQDCYIN